MLRAGQRHRLQGAFGRLMAENPTTAADIEALHADLIAFGEKHWRGEGFTRERFIRLELEAMAEAGMPVVIPKARA